MKRRTGKERFLIVMGVVIQAVCLFPWVAIGERSYNGIVYLFRMLSGGIEKTVLSDMGITAEVGKTLGVGTESVALLIQLIMITIIQLLCLVHLLRSLGRKQPGDAWIGASGVLGMLCCITITMGNGTIYSNRMSGFYPLLVMIVAAIAFMGGKMVEVWNEANEREREQNEKLKEAREEKHRRLKFEGKYTSDFYRVVWKNFRSSWKDYKLFAFAGIASVSMIFVGAGMREMMKPMDMHNDFATGRGIDSVLMNFYAVFTILAVALLSFILLFYLKTRMKSLGVFVTLGIRKKALNLLVGLELAGCMLLSVVGGILLGNGLLYLFGRMIRKFLDHRIELADITFRTYRLAIILIILVFLLAFIITYIFYKEMNIGKMKDEAIRKEKMPGRWKKQGLVIGIVFLVWGIFQFVKMESAEGLMCIGLFFAGLYLVLRNGLGIWLSKRRKQETEYYGDLILRNPLYHRFKNCSRYLILLSIVHICALFMFSKDLAATMIAPEAKTMLPYDYVCLATEDDDDLFEKISETCGAEVLSYPMVRVSSADRALFPDPYEYRKVIEPQGQNIGISASTYRKLKEQLGEEAADLSDLTDDGKKIYVAYQQDIGDNAKPLDYYIDRKHPNLHIGGPATGYWYIEREKIFTPRTVIGSETGALTGALRAGTHENVVVFSDKYFESVKDNWKKEDYATGKSFDVVDEMGEFQEQRIHKWPNKLQLIRLNGTDKETVDVILREFKERHAFEEHFDSVVLSYYEKEQTAGEIESERLLRQIVNSFIVCILLVISIFILYLKVEGELPETIQRYEFLNYMGMPEKERIRSIKRELGRFVWIPLLITAVTVPVFTGIVWKLRHFTAADCMNYLWIIAAIAAMYVVVEIVALKCLQNYVIRRCMKRRKS